MTNHIIYISTHNSPERNYAKDEYYATTDIDKGDKRFDRDTKFNNNKKNLLGPQMVLDADELLSDADLEMIVFEKIKKEGHQLLEKDLKRALYTIAGDREDFKKKVQLLEEVDNGKIKVTEEPSSGNDTISEKELKEVINTLIDSDANKEIKVHLHGETKEQDEKFFTPVKRGDTITWKIKEGSNIQKIVKIECLFSGSLYDKFEKPPKQLANGNWFGKLCTDKKKDPEMGKYYVHFVVDGVETVFVEDPDVPSSNDEN